MTFLDDSSENSNMIVRLGGILLLGVILLSGFTQGALSTSQKSVTLNMTQNPVDGDTLTLGDNVFEFDSDNTVESGNIPVLLEGTLYQTGENLKAAITNAGYGVQ